MDLNGGCSHLQRCLIEESDELSREENNHLLSQELCRVKDREIYSENQGNQRENHKTSSSGAIKLKVSTGKLRWDKEVEREKKTWTIWKWS